jgi:hypothetical protein
MMSHQVAVVPFKTFHFSSFSFFALPVLFPNKTATGNEAAHHMEGPTTFLRHTMSSTSNFLPVHNEQTCLRGTAFFVVLGRLGSFLSIKFSKHIRVFPLCSPQRSLPFST